MGEALLPNDLSNMSLSESGGCNSKTEFPDSLTDQPLPSAPEVALPDSTVFPFFSLLPAELRLQIFEIFALPKAPFICVIYAKQRPMIFLHGRFRRWKKEFWSLRQVNREARQAVLRKRQAVGDRQINRRRQPLMFVNWDHDLAFFGSIKTLPTWKANIQHFACSLTYKIGKLSADYDLKGGSYIDPVANLPSLRCVYFFLTHISIPHFRYENYLKDDRFRPAPRKVPEVQRGDYEGIPFSVEALTSSFPGEVDEGFFEWCEEFVQRINWFQDDMQDFLSGEYGRPIKCKTIMAPPGWNTFIHCDEHSSYFTVEWFK